MNGADRGDDSGSATGRLGGTCPPVLSRIDCFHSFEEKGLERWHNFLLYHHVDLCQHLVAYCIASCRIEGRGHKRRGL